MARVFATHDMLQLWASPAAPDGLRLGDVADAMAEYWVSNWVMANRRPDPTAGQVRAARDQVRRMLASSPALARLDLDLRALVLTDRGLAERG